MADTKKLKRKAGSKGGKMDITFLSILLILLTIGLVMLFSASYAYSLEYYGSSYKFISRQAMFAGVGIVIMLLVSKIDYHFWRKFAWIAYGLAIILLGVLLVLPPMVAGMDVKRWMVLGPINFQPSELAKLEPHLSATVLVFCIGIVLLIIGGLPKRYIIGGAGAGVVGVAALILSGAVGYGSDRIKYWLDPWADATGLGFQTIQSLLAIGSGGILGRGIGQSRQKYLWVPEPHNDFIFSIVCEELGLVGALVIILLFALLVWRGFTIAMHAPDKFGSLMAIGLTFQVGLQAMLNIWVVTNTIPNTGISLPFFSYGGTSLVILLAEMGIVLSISRGANIEKT